MFQLPLRECASLENPDVVVNPTRNGHLIKSNIYDIDFVGKFGIIGSRMAVVTSETKDSRHSPEGFVRYLPIDDPVFDGPLYLTGAGRAVIPPGVEYPPPGHPDLYQFDWGDGRVLPEFSLFWVEEGEGEWETEDGVWRIGAGQVGHVFAGQWHRYRPEPQTGWTECWIQFNGRLAHELESSGYLARERPVVSPPDPERFALRYAEFLTDVAGPGFSNTTSQGLRVLGLLGLAGGDRSPGVVPPSDSLVERARRHIWSHSHRQLDVGEVAARVGVGRRTLERAFAAAGSSTVLDEITRCRINRAERLLRETRLPVRQVARLAGFGTDEQMRLRFMERHGRPPAAWRKSGA